jgi:hypothetical protein
MPGAQPRGTHAFEPSSQPVLNNVDMTNADSEDEGEDEPLLDLSLANIPQAMQPMPSSTFPLVTLNHGIPSGATPTIASSGSNSALLPLNPSFSESTTSVSVGTRPPPSSSLPPTFLPTILSQQRDLSISMGSINSRESESDAASGSNRKRKYDRRSASDTRSKRSLKSKTSELNPVIISNALNSTLNRLADVMEKTLDATAPTIAPPPVTAIPTTTPPATTIPLTAESRTAQPLDTSSNSSSASPEEILNQAIGITTSDYSLTEDQILAASLFFNSASDDAIRAAHTYIALGKNKVVQHRFLLRQLETLFPGKGKGRAAADSDDGSMTF